MKQKKRVILWVVVTCVILAGYFAARVAVHAVHQEGIRNRATSDMQSIAEAVDYYRKIHGHLPAATEFADLPPAPDSTFKDAETEEMRSLSEARPRELLDGWGRPYRSEPNGQTFHLFSLGEDGDVSRDDIVYAPKK